MSQRHRAARPARPKDAEKQRRHYSGKKKRHGVKNMVLVGESLRIQFLSSTHAASVHDKTIADSTPYPLPDGSYLMQDLGLLGFDLDGVTLIMPAKKPPGGELSAKQKELNRKVSRDLVMEVCCALHNLRYLRLRFRPWKLMA